MRKLIALLCLFPLAMAGSFAADRPLTQDERVELANNTEHLRHAVINDKVGDIRHYLDAGVSPNTILASGDTPLTLAYRSESWNAVNVLLKDKRTDINFPNRMGETPLMMAIFKNRDRDAKALLERGAAVNLKRGWTPLHYAAANGDWQILDKLIALGANVNAQTRGGITPLMMAARRPSRYSVDRLLRAGAFRDYCSRDRKSVV